MDGSKSALVFGPLLIGRGALGWQQKNSLMQTFFLGFLNAWEIVLILAVVLLLVGTRKLPGLAKNLGQGLKEFKKAIRDGSEQA